MPGFLGLTNDTAINTPQVDSNSFQYGGGVGAAQARQDQLQGLGQQAANTGAKGNDYSGVKPYQSAQDDALGMMRGQAQGNDGGVAEMQLQQGAANAAQQQMAGAASARGGGASIAAAQNAAANNASALGAGANFQAAQLRAQNQQAGIQNYGNYAQSAIGQQAQMAQANGQLGLGYAGIQQGYEGMSNQVAQDQLNAQMQQQQLQSQNQLAQQQQASAQGNANADRNSSLLGMAGGAVGGAAGAIAGLFSDENLKTNITPQSSAFAASSPIGHGKKAGGGDFFSPSNYASDPSNPIGESQLAARDAHTANFAQMGNGMGNWFNASNAKPWSPESDAANANLSHYMGMNSGNAGMQQNPNSPHFMLSDEHSKRAFQSAEAEGALPRGLPPARNAVQAFAQSVRPVTYQYKDPRENGGNTRLGFLAQDIERSPTGRDLVKDTPRGKMVDVAALSSANAAVGGEHERRISALEQAMRRAA